METMRHKQSRLISSICVAGILTIAALLLPGCSGSNSALKKAERIGTVEAFAHLREDYPEFNAIAKQRIRQIEAESALRMGTREAMEPVAMKYPELLLLRYPENKYFDALSQRLERIRIDDATRSLAKAKTVRLSVVNMDISKDSHDFQPIQESVLVQLLKLAGLSAITNDSSDVSLMIQFEARAEGAYWSPGGGFAYYGTIPSGAKWYWSGGRVYGRITIADRTNECFMDFGYSSNNFISDGSSPNRILPERREDAPYRAAFVRSDLEQKLVYLLTLGKGTAWIASLNEETGDRISPDYLPGSAGSMEPARNSQAPTAHDRKAALLERLINLPKASRDPMRYDRAAAEKLSNEGVWQVHAIHTLDDITKGFGHLSDDGQIKPGRIESK